VELVVGDEGVSSVVAGFPGDSRRNTQGLLGGGEIEVLGDGIEVVAKGRWVALGLDVVVVDVGVGVENELHDGLAGLEGAVGVFSGLELLQALVVSGVHLAVDAIVDELVGISEWSVLSELDDWSDPSVSDGGSLHVYNLSARGLLLSDVSTDSWDVVPTVGLTSEVEVEWLVLRVLLEESLDEGPHLDLDASFVVDVVGVGVTVASSGGLIDPADGGLTVPRVRVWNELEVVVHSEGTVFEEESELTAASRSTSEPEDDWIAAGVRLTLKAPVEDVGVVELVDVDVARVLHDIELRVLEDLKKKKKKKESNISKKKKKNC